MREIRICVAGVPLAIGPVTLTGQAARHVSRVLRCQPGDSLTLFDGAGHGGQAVIRRLKRDSVEVELLTLGVADRESPLQTRLVMAMVRSEPMDLVVQKATELGAKALRPLVTERTVVRPSRTRLEKRLAHWQRVAASACEQCGRNTLPRIEPPLELPAWLGDIGAPSADEVRLLANPGATGESPLLRAPVAKATLLVGPEGGLSDAEIDLVIQAGFAGISLGPRILRAETAAIALLSLVQWQLGDLGRG